MSDNFFKFEGMVCTNPSLSRYHFRKYLYTILLPLILMLNIVTGYAETLRFGVFSAPPWGMESEGGINGITVDQIKAIVDHAGFDMQISFSPYPRMIKQLNEGVIDCAIATKNPSTGESVEYLSALYDLDIAVISRRDNRLKSDEKITLFNRKSRGRLCKWDWSFLS